MPRAIMRVVMPLLLVTVLTTQLIPPLPSAPPAHAQTPLANAVVGFFNVIGAIKRRNRVYREARATQGEMNEYYESLIGASQEQLLDRQLMGTGRLSQENRTQTRVYIRLRAALEAERVAVTQQIEAEKRQARGEFHRRVADELVQVLVRSPGGQSLLNDIRDGIDELRQAAEAVEAAIAENRPFDALARELSDKAGRIPLLQDAAYNLGQQAGRKLDQLLGGVLSDVDNAMASMQSGMGEAMNELDRIDGELAQFDETERVPVSLVEEGGPLGQINGVDRANAAADVAAQAYTNAAIIAGQLRNPTEAEKEKMRDRIRSQLLQNRLDRLQAATRVASHVVCGGVGRGEYIEAASELGLAPEEPADPSSTGYLVCRDTETGALVHAALIGEALVEATVTPEDMAAETTEPDAAEPPPLLGDRCSLSGEGDFVLENITVTSQSSTCEDDEYPTESEGEVLLLYLAGVGKWVVVEETPVTTTWEWQATGDTEGAIIAGTAVADGSTLEIDVSIDVPPGSSSIPPLDRNGNGLALLGLLPLFPLSWKLTSKRRRRWLLLAITFLALLLTAQSCDIYGTVSGSYSFPLPADGFACEIEPENPNLAEMPGGSGEVVLQLTIDSINEEGVVTSSDTCEISAHMSGTGVLKRDGFYTPEDFE